MTLAQLTAWDYVVVLVLGISILFGLLRGLIRTLAGLAGWVVAFLGAPMLASLLSGHIGEAVPPWVIVVVLFVALLLVVRLLGALLARVTRKVGLGSVDRGLGVLVGAARALLVVAAIAVGGYLFGLDAQPSWQQALSRPLLDGAVQVTGPWLPGRLATTRARQI